MNQDTVATFKMSSIQSNNSSKKRGNGGGGGGRGQGKGRKGNGQGNSDLGETSNQNNKQRNNKNNNNNGKKNGNNKGQQRNQKNIYKDHLDSKEIESRIALGDVDSIEAADNNEFKTLFFGKLRINSRSRKNAFVTCRPLTGCSNPPLPCDVYIEGENERNRALDGDIVAVELLPLSDWAADSSTQPTSSSTATDIATTLDNLTIDDKPQEEEEDTLWRPLFKTEEIPQVSSTQTLCTAGDLAKQGQLQPKGKVVGVIKPGHRVTIDGVLAPLNQLPAGACLPLNEKWMVLQPSDKRYPYTLVSRIDVPPEVLQNPSSFASTLWLVDLDENWIPSSKLPRARTASLRRLGEVGDIAAEHEALTRSFGVDHGHFSDEVLECANAFLTDGEAAGSGVWSIPSEEIAKRKDFRKHRIFTIDPTTAKDLDDALHITLMDDGTVEIGVHIADVSHFVQDGSPLDEEAQRRATSVYLVHGVIPMLPSVLCEDLCSLNPGVDRLAFSCVWRMTRDGSLAPNTPIWFGKSVIRSCAKLDYATAQRMIDKVIPVSAKYDEVPDSDWEFKRRPEAGWSMAQVINDVLLMNEVAMARRERRFSSTRSSSTNLQGGALSLHRTKLCFQLDNLGNPAEVFAYPIKDSNRLVEEYMLLANFLVAQNLVLKCQSKALLRSHPRPVQQGLDSLQSLFEKLFKAASSNNATTQNDTQPTFNSSSAGSLHASLLQLQELFPTNSSVHEACMTILTHPMKPAVYIAAGSKSSNEWRHYALNIPYYTHFTSPIRRYPDIIVHRLLHAIVCDENNGILNTQQSSQPETEAAVSAPKPCSMVSQMWSEDQITLCASRCNEMKEAAKGASERSDYVYLCVLLKKTPVVVEAVVIGVGPKSFTLQLPSLGIENRACVDDIDGVESVQHDEASESLTITRSSTMNGWTSIKMRIFSKLKVKVSCRPKPPLEVAVEILGFVAESPLAQLDSLSNTRDVRSADSGSSGGPSVRINQRAGKRVIKHALS